MQPNLSVNELKRMPIPCPSIEIQNRIVNSFEKEEYLVESK
jgi:restriction endonuclease S subunit